MNALGKVETSFYSDLVFFGTKLGFDFFFFLQDNVVDRERDTDAEEQEGRHERQTS